jgi:hypothetical protein
MTIKGYGSSKPIADNKTKEGSAKNRGFDYATYMGCDLSYDIPSGELGERG